MSDRSILVRIASYRDPELARTIASAWETASNPKRVKFAIVQQAGPETVDQLSIVSKDSRVSSFQVDWTLARGIGWARRLTDRMWQGEDFTLQIDAHTRFAQGWDDALIGDFESLSDARAVLSCYPGRFVINDESTATLYQASPHKIVPAGEDEAGVPRQTGGEPCAGGTPALLVAGGFQFSAGTICSEVEQIRDASLGDEFIRAVQLFTHGWNVYVPNAVPLFHLYQQDAPERAHSYSADCRSDPKLVRVMHKLRMRSLEALSQTREGTLHAAIGSVRSRENFYSRLQHI